MNYNIYFQAYKIYQELLAETCKSKNLLMLNFLYVIAQLFYGKIFRTLCSCALDDTFVPTLLGMTKSYQKGIEDLVASGRYDTSEDFTVVLQPFMKLMRPPTKVKQLI